MNKVIEVNNIKPIVEKTFDIDQLFEALSYLKQENISVRFS
ncbi:hypothetical protein [Arcticibacter eurypsychrophilus]|nr:hypothetical protein [Arcticibacter eurypsychrophilus]